MAGGGSRPGRRIGLGRSSGGRPQSAEVVALAEGVDRMLGAELRRVAVMLLEVHTGAWIAAIGKVELAVASERI